LNGSSSVTFAVVRSASFIARIAADPDVDPKAAL